MATTIGQPSPASPALNSGSRTQYQQKPPDRVLVRPATPSSNFVRQQQQQDAAPPHHFGSSPAAIDESSHSPAVGFSDLPHELLIHIFSFLTIDESPIPLDTPTNGRADEQDVYLPTFDPEPHPTQTELTRSTLLSLSLVCRDFYASVKPFLWDSVVLHNGKGWMRVVDALVEEVVVDANGEVVQPQSQSQPFADATANATAASSANTQPPLDVGSSADAPAEYAAQLLSPQLSATKSPSLLPPISPETLTSTLHGSSSPSKPQILCRQPTPLILPVNELTFSTAPPLEPHPLEIDEEEVVDVADLGLENASRPNRCMGNAYCQASGRGCCGPRSQSRASEEEMQERRGRTMAVQAGWSSSGLNLILPQQGQPEQQQAQTPENGRQTSPASAGSGSGSTAPSANLARVAYLPALLTPPASRQVSPAPAPRLRSRSRSQSHSRSRSRGQPVGAGRRDLSPERAVRPGGMLRRASTLRRTSTAESAVDEEDADEAELGERSMGGIIQRLNSMSEHVVGTERLQVAYDQARRGRRRNDEERDILDYFGEDWRHGVQELDDEVFEVDSDTPGPLIKHLSFANFRTTGTRRTQEEAVRGKFVTGGRLEGVLKNAPKLRSLAMTEYVDSSLTLPVLTELFFRGYERPAHPYSAEQEAIDGQSSTTHHVVEYVPYEPETDEEQWERRATFSQMEALDFTGCVSKVFGESLVRFVQGWLVPPHETDADRGRTRGRQGEENASTPSSWTRPSFPGLKRLSLRGCVTLSPGTIAALLACCPSLTHLDLSFTRVSPEALQVLASQPDLRLVALSLARSTRLTSESLRDFLLHAPCAATITDLNMYGDQTYESPLTPEDLGIIIRYAPCFQAGQLRYLDLSAAPFTAELLDPEVFPAQPRLKSLGLSFIPLLPLQPLATFLRVNAPHVEILTLTHSSTRVDLALGLSSLAINMNLHAKLVNPLCLPPFSVYGPSYEGPGAPTRLRIIELSQTVRKALGPSGGNWKTIRSKGGRGWYVDCAAGWIGEFDPATQSSRIVYRRLLSKDHPWRRYLEQLSLADGKVSSGVGWHSRKMEVVKGHGMMGREEGLYGAGAFAFEG